ncbi:unnamed protein product [Coregonus sp. 'balchen']|nr:unnamed protein product [Coregonus sp. 'balchen']
MPPFHFTASIQSTSITVPGTARGRGKTPITWTLALPTHGSLTLRPNRKFLELRRENQRILLHGDNSRGMKSTEDFANSRARSGERGEQASRWETEWRLDTERLRAESERLRGQVEALKETAGRQREEMRIRERKKSDSAPRLNSVNDILALQEEEMVEKTLSNPLLKNGPKGTRVLRRWREKVFMLLVQLRSKDIELRGEKDKLHSIISSLEQEVKKEKYQSSVFQHSLQDRTAELDLERMAREAVTQAVARTQRENTSWSQKAGVGLKTVTEAVQSASVRELQAELASACEERDKVTQELKRTPELIESALADVLDSEVRQLRQAAERSRGEAQESQAAREEAQQRLQEAHTQLEESSLNLEQLHAQLISQQETSDRALQERVFETEDCCAQQLRVMESLLNTARREHTKAVLALCQFEIQAEGEREQEREAHCLQSEHTKREIQDLQKLLQDKDRNLHLGTVRERGLMSEYEAARTTALQTSVALEEQQRPSGKSNTLKAKDKPQTIDSLLSVLGDIQTLSAAVVLSSEDNVEEDGGWGGALQRQKRQLTKNTISVMTFMQH